MINLFNKTLSELEKAFNVLESQIDKPQFVKRGSRDVFRYENPTIKAAIIQKLARVISGLHASLVLLQAGFVQELGAILRTLDEFNEDIIFLCQSLSDGKLTDLHKKYLDSFYQEEFNEPDNPFLSEQNRPTIPRRKIHAAISNIPGFNLNPSDHKELLRTLSQAYSGYVHGASVHIMDMYGGNPPHYHITGMLGTPRIAEFTRITWDYFYRGLLYVMLVAHSFGQDELLKKLFAVRDYFEKQSGQSKWESPEKLINKMKKKKT